MCGSIYRAMKRLLVALVSIICGCDSRAPDVYEPIAAEGALVQLDFEASLETLGSAPIVGEAHGGDAQFDDGISGKALYSVGDGRWVYFETVSTITIGNAVNIAFDFKPAEGINPNRKGRGTQTVAVISSASPAKIWHISFNVLAGSRNPYLYVNFDDTDGNKYKLRSKDGSVGTDWHNVQLHIDRQAQETKLYIDGALIDSETAVPTVVDNGIDRIKLGTWHKQNQAYRGHIDNFAISEAGIGVNR